MKGSLVVVGSGIKFISHLTTESKASIEQADKVLYLVNEPAMQEWIQKTNSSSESLDEIYFNYSLRSESYHAITQYILDHVRQEKNVCVVLYGHPTIFATPAIEAVKQAKNEGFFATVLPGISAEDCLFADLHINPGSHGCLSYDATDFLIRKRMVDPSCHVILWQAGIIGALGHPKIHCNIKGAKILLEYLLQFYLPDHSVIIYTAAQYPGLTASIQELKLVDLPHLNFSRIATLYIPPSHQAPCDAIMLKKLEIN